MLKFPGTPLLLFELQPDPSNPRDEQPWVGILHVKTTSVARLVQEGFSIAKANVINEECFIGPPEYRPLPDTEESWWRRQYGVTRHIILRDLQQPPRWAADLHCMARDMLPELGRIRLGGLTHRNVHKCAAILSNGREFDYYFLAGTGGINIRCPDMSLDGLWPWPRKLVEGEEENTAPRGGFYFVCAQRVGMGTQLWSFRVKNGTIRLMIRGLALFSGQF
ncbi:hypothetical protein PG991_011961 [Apiospora marii]|uniref:Uncharacterized protein n=1 Tax=Apiospora marii TaxID=335849 RepID=A0ABR1RG12_9PEZI